MTLAPTNALKRSSNEKRVVYRFGAIGLTCFEPFGCFSILLSELRPELDDLEHSV